MGVVVSCVLTFSALALIALAMTKHHRQAFGRAPAAGVALALRIAGGGPLCLAPIPWMRDRGPTVSLVTWIFCGLPLAGLVAVGLFTALGAKRPGETLEA